MSLLSANSTTSATLFTGRGNVMGIYVRGAATAGTLVLKDGGSGGTSIITINTPAVSVSGQLAPIYIQLPDEGVLFKTDCYATLTTADAVTIFYRSMH